MSLAVAFALVSLGSCDTLFGDDSDGNSEDDGTLIVQLLDGGSNPCPDDLELEGPNGLAMHNTPVFTVWVYPAGSTDEAGYVAFGSATFDGTSNSVVSINKGDTDDQWQGTGGESYDVYPAVYCTVADVDGSIDHYDDAHWEDAWAAVHKGHGSQGWGVPITYKQDGNKTATTAGNDYGRLLITTVTVRVTDIPTRDSDPFQDFYVRVFDDGVAPDEHNAVAGNNVTIGGGDTAEVILHSDDVGTEWTAIPGETYQVLLMLFGADSGGGPSAPGSRHLFFTYTQYTDGMELVKAFVDGAWGDPGNLQF